MFSPDYFQLFSLPQPSSFRRSRSSSSPPPHQFDVPFSEHLTVFIHLNLDALLEPARPALVAVCLVDGAGPPSAVLADVGSIPPDASLEESTAAVAGVDPIVLTGATVPTHLAGDVQDATCNEAERWIVRENIENKII